MLKKTFTIMLSALCCTALLTACGGNSSSSSDSKENTEATADDGALKVRPESTNIGGKFGKAFNFDDKEYTIKMEDGWGGDKKVKMSITMTRNDVKPSVNFNDIAGSHDAGKKYVGDIEAEFLDENILSIEEILHQYCDVGIKVGTYTCLDNVRIWKYEE